MKPRIAITAGDPAGIGPEIAAKAAADPAVLAVCEPVIYGPDPQAAFPPGVLSAEAGRAAYDAICNAVRDAQAGRVAAIATAPVNKLAFARAGLPWMGHTDLRKTENTHDATRMPYVFGLDVTLSRPKTDEADASKVPVQPAGASSSATPAATAPAIAGTAAKATTAAPAKPVDATAPVAPEAKPVTAPAATGGTKP